MDSDHLPPERQWMKRVGGFMERHIFPAEPADHDQMTAAREKGNLWIIVPVVEEV